MPSEGDSPERQRAERNAQQRRFNIKRYGLGIGRAYTDYELATSASAERKLELREKLLVSITDYMLSGDKVGKLWAVRALADLPQMELRVNPANSEGGK
jgi:hypothetical protein